MDLLPEPPKGLVEALKDRAAVAIVGSGLSCAAGGPSWRDLLLGLAAEAESTQPHAGSKLAAAIAGMDGGRYLDAASLIKSVLQTEFQDAVARQLGQRQKLVIDQEAVARRGDTSLFKERGLPEPITLRPTMSHWYLTQLGFRAIVTTNYDNLLEDAWPPPVPASYSWSYEHLARRVQGRTPFILKVHGDLHHPDDIILAREDYTRELFTSRAREALRSLFGTSQLFWIGYGHNDPDLDLLLDECRAKLGVRGGYAIALRDDHLTCTRLGHADITGSLLASHADIPRFLRRLAELVGRRLIFTITLSVDWPGEREAQRLGEDLASTLSRFAGDVRVWGVEPGSTTVHLEAAADALATLRSRCEARETDLAELLRQRHVTSFDGIGIEGRAVAPSAVERGPSRVATVAPSAVERGLSRAAAAVTHQPHPARRKRVTVELSHEGVDLLRTYWFDDGASVTSRQRLDTIGRGYRVGQVLGISALHGLLERDDLNEIKVHLAGDQLEKAGEMLFEVLFGPGPEAWGPVLRAAFTSGPGENPRPPRYPLRVRITTADPALGKVLLGLPWRATMFAGRILSDDGWTFEVCAGRDAGAEITYHAPGSVLILAPEYGTGIDSPLCQRRLRQPTSQNLCSEGGE